MHYCNIYNYEKDFINKNNRNFNSVMNRIYNEVKLQ